MTEATTKLELNVSDGGRWQVRSESATVCHLDLDRMLLKRARGAGSPVLPHDGEWVQLVRITSISHGDAGIVRVGDRHEFLTDPDPDSNDHRWWIPRTCTAIEPELTDDRVG
ncbi:hypothetical protein CELL_03204 [Cellulomonas sp. T2.31MG-18]|uniref:hypothetical protein n=1 Tax=Cellulomonas sp. T2.31MG-18 TaxID=3157619 RepID=UPI0035E505D2